MSATSPRAAMPSSARQIADDWDEEALDDEQIKVLLRQAEQRLGTLDDQHGAVTNSSAVVKIHRLNPGSIPQPYIASAQGVARADRRRLAPAQDRQMADTVRQVENPVIIRTEVVKGKRATAGPDFFDLPRTDVTPELKRDLQLLKMRSILDPHQHYKRDNSKNPIPEYSQVGTIVEGPTEYFSSRIPNKKRKRTFVEEVLAGEGSTGRFRQKYNEIQSSKTSGKKAYHKQQREKRRQGKNNH
ncbi:hypothetical protein MMC21_004700 [Puttea exsequens]|nr:hypothetical protein [Puttea exsequens]